MAIFIAIFSYIYALVVSILPLNSYSEGLVGQPVSYLPSRAVTLEDRTISRLIFRGVFKYDIYGTLVPDLAETWAISEDGTVYTIKIKDRQYWSDGRKITSDDLIYTSYKVADLAGVGTDKVDDLTVRYILPNRYSPFLNLLTVGVMPSGAEESMNNLKPVSSGDFMVGSVEKNGAVVKKTTLVSTKSEFDIKKLIFRYYSNESELVTASKLGEIDAFMSAGEHELDNFENNRFPLQGIYYSLLFNLRTDKFKDQVLRQKLEKVLPIDKLIADRGITVQGPISRSAFTDKNLTFDKYDLLFKDNLRESTLSITIPDSDLHLSLAKRIKDIWENSLNLNVKILRIKPEDMQARVVQPRNFEVLLYGQEIGRDPDRYAYWHSTQKDWPQLNITGIDNVRVDRSLEEGRNEITNEKRIDYYNDFQKVILDQVPAIFLYHPYINYYVSKHINGLGQKYTFTPADRFLDFFNWKRVGMN